MRTYFIETWGCQMNHHDSEHLEGLLRRHGLEPAVGPMAADLVLLNTCSVRERPVQKILSRIGALATQELSPRIGVCGCVAEQEAGALMDRSAAVAFVMGPGQIGRIGEVLRAVAAGERPVLTGFGADPGSGERAIVRRSLTRGMVTVIEGCDEYCTFCVVPRTRGRQVSRPLPQILGEVRAHVRAGLLEVELLGQTVNAYRCPETGADLADLLAVVADVPGLPRVRFITSHPRHFQDRLISVLRQKVNLSRYLHLPFQAGSDRILRRMNRKYSARDYLDLVERIRTAVPDVNLSTDVIVGFPGETEQDFLESIRVLERVRFGQVFAFAFSPRPGTPAARYSEQVEDEVKRERLNRLFAVSDRISLDLNRQLEGSLVKVLIDGESRRSNADWQGRCEDNRVVNFPKTGPEREGDIVTVRVTRAGAHSLYGELTGAGRRLRVLDPSSRT